MLIIILIVLTTTACKKEYYNEVDKSDFEHGTIVKFELINFKNVLDEQTIKEFNLSSSSFLFMSSMEASGVDNTFKNWKYFGWVKNSKGGIYYMDGIPVTNVRIYEDLEKGDPPTLVAFESFDNRTENVNNENQWGFYSTFNLHVPKGTIIPKINLNLNEMVNLP